jgi:hypothetical protein
MTAARALPGRSLTVLILSCLAAACHGVQVRYADAPDSLPEPRPGQATLFLLGDGGEDNVPRRDVLTHLSQNISAVAADGAGPPVAVVFLGDNIYDDGVRPDFVEEDVEKLRGQVYALGRFPNVRGVFVPGNHDWANGRSDEAGLAAIFRQRDGIERLSEGRNVRLLPDDGCPGPVSEPLGTSVQLVFFDSEWLLREPRSQCGTPEDFYRRMEEELRAHRHRRVIVMSHHPLVSGGPHGGNVGPFEHGPLVYYLSIKAGVSRQDRASAAYSAMAERLEAAFAASGAPPLIQAAGHDHNLQVINLVASPGSDYQLVSGSAARNSAVRRVEGTRYATDGFGYMRLDFDEAAVRLRVYARESEGGPVRTVFACSLTSSPGPSDCAEARFMGEGR